MAGNQACSGAAPNFNIRAKVNKILVIFSLKRVNPTNENTKIIEPRVWLKKYFRAVSPEFVFVWRRKGINASVFNSKANQAIKKDGEDNIISILKTIQSQNKSNVGVIKIGEGEIPSIGHEPKSFN